MSLGAVIVSTPQDVALLDARKGVHMFRKVNVPVCCEYSLLGIMLKFAKIFGLLVNSAYYRCPSCSDKHHIFGPLDSARRTVEDLGLMSETISGPLGEVPMVSEVSSLGDQGRLGEIFIGEALVASKPGLKDVRSIMESVATHVWGRLENPTTA